MLTYSRLTFSWCTNCTSTCTSVETKWCTASCSVVVFSQVLIRALGPLLQVTKGSPVISSIIHEWSDTCGQFISRPQTFVENANVTGASTDEQNCKIQWGREVSKRFAEYIRNKMAGFSVCPSDFSAWRRLPQAVAAWGDLEINFYTISKQFINRNGTSFLKSITFDNFKFKKIIHWGNLTNNEEKTSWIPQLRALAQGRQEEHG